MDYEELHSQFHGVNPSARVELVVHRSIQMIVAIKMMEKKHLTLKKLSHPPINRLFEILNGKKFAYLVQEYVQGGTLKEQILKGRLPEEKARTTCGQLVSALKCCDQNIIHRDLKPDNIC
ncbi:hypothetical protein U0070_022845 [Myodes glareolus]|uniref:non-specific serine/threonine protein kinase n=1 Tax=Myodes glareolus TaxID=447135 RepID=A0AAW0K6C3_MYOGA